MDVRVTHPAGADFDEHLVFTGRRQVEFLYFPLAVRGRDNGRFHVFPLSQIRQFKKRDPQNRVYPGTASHALAKDSKGGMTGSSVGNWRLRTTTAWAGASSHPTN